MPMDFFAMFREMERDLFEWAYFPNMYYTGPRFEQVRTHRMAQMEVERQRAEAQMRADQERERAEAQRREAAAREAEATKREAEAEARRRDEEQEAFEREVAALRERKQAERTQQESRWITHKAVTREDKQNLCLHSRFEGWVRTSHQRKVKCKKCGIKRSMITFSCPYCELVVCPMCRDNLAKERLAMGM